MNSFGILILLIGALSSCSSTPKKVAVKEVQLTNTTRVVAAEAPITKAPADLGASSAGQGR